MTRKADTVFTYDRSGTDPDTITGIKQIYPDWQVEKKDKSFKSALYAQLSTALFKKLHITAGLRYQYFDYNDYYSFSPRLGLSYYLGPKTTLSVGYGKHFQSPAFVYFAWNDKNKELTSYSTEQVVLGFQKIIGEDIKITAETYYKNYKNLPMFKRFTTADPFDFYDNQMINAGDGKAYGVELFFQKKLTKNFSSIISYAWSVSQTKDLRDNSWYNGDYDYRNVFTFIGGYKIRFYKKDWFRKAKKTWWYKTTSWLLPLSDEVEWSLKYRYLGGRPYTPKTYHPEYHAWIEDENQSSNSVRLPEYSRLDIRLDKRFFFDSWNMVNYFDIANIFKRKNIWEYQYNHEDGTKEKVLQFQPMLVGGVIIEF